MHTVPVDTDFTLEYFPQGVMISTCGLAVVKSLPFEKSHYLSSQTVYDRNESAEYLLLYLWMVTVSAADAPLDFNPSVLQHLPNASL